MQSWIDWIGDKVREIPGDLVTAVKHDISSAAGQAWENIRTDVANAANQVGAAITSSTATSIAPAGRSPVTIPLSSGQLLAVAIALAALVGFVVYKAVK